MQKTWIACAMLVVGLPGFNGCSGGPEIAAVGALGTEAAVSVEAAAAAAAADADEGMMHLEAGDKIRLTVFGEDKLSGEYEIDPSGFLSLPLAGTFKVSGQTKVELERTVTSKLRSNYLKDPKVTIEVVSFRPIYVLGEVQKPGEYTYRSGLNVMSALAVAGGSTYRASHSRVMIQRFGQTELKEYALDPSVAVMPGDVIRLPERYF